MIAGQRPYTCWVVGRKSAGLLISSVRPKGPVKMENNFLLKLYIPIKDLRNTCLYVYDTVLHAVENMFELYWTTNTW